MKIIDVHVHVIKLLIFKVLIIGNISAISTSKIKKIIAIKKNRKEKGIRDELKGSNPHSNGDVFSRSYKDFFETKLLNIMTIIEIIKMIDITVIILNIIYIMF